MLRQILHRISFFVLCIVALTSNFNTTRAAEKTPQKTPEATSKMVYTVYAGNCSRSIRVVHSGATAMAVCWKAEALKKKNRYVFISTGKIASGPYVFISSGRLKGLKTCSVYRRSCKAYALETTTTSRKKADEVVKKIVGEKDVAQVVYHFEPKGS